MAARITADRKYIRTAVTKLHTQLSSTDPSQIQGFNAPQKLLELKNWESRLGVLNTQYQDLIWDDVNPAAYESDLASCDEYYAKIAYIQTALTRMSARDTASATQSGSQRGPTSGGGRTLQLKRPHAPIPKLPEKAGGSGLKKFFHEFEAVTNQYELDSYEKFIMLKQNLTGRAATIVENLNISNQHYETTKKLLLDALANETTIKFELIERLLTFSSSKYRDSYIFVSEFNLLVEEIDLNKVTINDILQYSLLKGMDKGLKDTLIQVSNKSFPSIDDYRKHIYESIERSSLHSAPPPKIKPPKTESMAININAQGEESVKGKGGKRDKPPKGGAKPKLKTKKCTLCEEGGFSPNEHPTSQCPKFQTPAEKLNFIKRNKGCTLCAYFSHENSACRFPFKNICFRCNQRHFYFLCEHEKSEKDNASAQPPTENVHHINASATWAFQALCHSSSILKTFTAASQNGNVIRFLKDEGSELTFFARSLIDNNPHKILQKTCLRVRGVNSTTQYNTWIARVYFIFEGILTPIVGIILPEIATQINLPRLGEIVKHFRDKGHILADKLLNEYSTKIEGIEVLFGSNMEQLLPCSTKVFGTDNSSYYNISRLGVLLGGNAESILKDLHSLPRTNDVTDETRLPDSDIEDITAAAQPAFVNTCNAFTATLSESIPNDSYASDENLTENFEEILGVEGESEENLHSEEDINVAEYILNTMSYDGKRLKVSLPWKRGLAEKLGSNFMLSKKILQNYIKQGQCFLEKTDTVIREQISLGIIEKIDFDKFKKHVFSYSFLPHMGILKEEKETTKLRIVYMANLCESKNKHVSHNQALHAGPNLNRKLNLTLINLRLEKFMFIFDLKKAFHMIKISDLDQNRLLFMWFKDVKNKNFDLEFFKLTRVPFGLPPSPAILMLCLYKILILDSENDTPSVKNLKRRLYNNIYMDNGAIQYSDPRTLEWAIAEIPKIFNEYGFEIQQCVTNMGSPENNDVKLLGMLWNPKRDELKTGNLNLNESARTKREVLSSLAAQFDIFGVYIPLLMSAKLFMQKLQACPGQWDTPLDEENAQEWQNIAIKFNKIPPIILDRYIGTHTDEYDILICTDASKHAMGLVAYARNLTDGKIHFLLGSTKLLGGALREKTIPALELAGIAKGAEKLLELKIELSSDKVVEKLNIRKLIIFSDSLVALYWIYSRNLKLKKINSKKSVFVRNKLSKIEKLSSEFPITFAHLPGGRNPADLTTRTPTYRAYMSSSYLTGNFLSGELCDHDITFTLPIEETPSLVCDCTCMVINLPDEPKPQLIPIDRFSCFRKLVNVTAAIMRYINNIKLRVKSKRTTFNGEILPPDTNFFHAAKLLIISRDQALHFPECIDYLCKKNKKLSDMPNIVAQLNLYSDQKCLRVGGKMKNFSDSDTRYCPWILAKDSKLAKLIVNCSHVDNAHAGKYHIINEIRKQFWIPQIYSFVQKILGECIPCKRVNNRLIKLNQNSYRDFRQNPPSIVFRHIFLDYFGPYFITLNGSVKQKVWVLAITCNWSRAINLKISLDLTIEAFLKALQLHIHEFGIPERVFSDLGSQFVPSGHIVEDFLKDMETQRFLQTNGIKGPKFEQFYKGNSALGSMVERLIKILKRLIRSTIGKRILDYFEFEFVISQIKSIANRRPVAFQESLRDNDSNDLPCVITPEMLLRGTEFVDLNVIPQIQPEASVHNFEDVSYLKLNFQKLQNCRESLINEYNETFVVNLLDQGIDRKGRYKRLPHYPLRIGDVVSIREENSKLINYPMGIVTEIHRNSLEEVTHVKVFKGSTRETVKRHVSQLIYLYSTLPPIEDSDPLGRDPSDSSDRVSSDPSDIEQADVPDVPQPNSGRPGRLAAQKNTNNRKRLIQDGLL